jgi:hypothetical protein
VEPKIWEVLLGPKVVVFAKRVVNTKALKLNTIGKSHNKACQYRQQAGWR